MNFDFADFAADGEIYRENYSARDISRPDIGPFKALKVPTGIGKTDAALRNAPRVIKAGKQVIVLVPTHRLADEAEARMNELAAAAGESGISVSVYRGREAKNPDTGEAMCRDPELVAEAQAAMADVGKTACKVCEHRDGCAYLAQAQILHLWIVPSALYWRKCPDFMEYADLLVIDEGFALDGIVGIGNSKLHVGIDDIERRPVSPKSTVETADLVAKLMPLRRKLLAALADHPPGPVQRDRLVAADLTATDAQAAHNLEWKAKIHGTGEAKDGSPLSRAALIKQCKAARGNRLISLLARLWQNLGAFLIDEGAVASGRIELVEETDEKTGASYRALPLYELSEPGTGWLRIPTLHLDATLDNELLKVRLPQAELVADIEAEAPYQRIVQVTGLAFSKSGLSHSKGQLDAAWTYARRLAQNAGGKWLVVMNKSAEDEIRAKGPVPPYVALGHFNGLRGIDEHRDIRGMVVIGRPMPPPGAVERLAGILTGRAVPPLDGWYPTCSTTIRAKDGSRATVDAVQHPDELAERIRASITQSELMQVIGRARGVRRTAADPVDIYVLGNEPLPVEVDRLEAWEAPSPDDAMLADGVWPENLPDAAAAYPGLVKSAEALKKARLRSRLGTFPYKYLSYENVPNLRQARYRRPGRGRSWCRAVYDSRIVPDIGAWLTKRLGEVQFDESWDGTDAIQEVAADSPEAATERQAETLTYLPEEPPAPPSRPSGGLLGDRRGGPSPPTPAKPPLRRSIKGSFTFSDLFWGFSRRHGRFTLDGGRKRGVKATGRARTSVGGAQPSDYQRHLDGVGPGIGILPLLDDSRTVYFGAIDIDDYDVDIAAVERDLSQLPVVLTRSKSGGIHIWLFCAEPIPATLVRKKLSEWAAALGCEGCEIFPKQEKRESEADVGNWINLPYYGNTRVAFIDGRDVDLETFVRVANERAITEKDLFEIEVQRPQEPGALAPQSHPPDMPNGSEIKP